MPWRFTQYVRRVCLKNTFGPRPAPPAASGGAFPRNEKGPSHNSDESRINERIRVPEIFLIDENGTQIGNMPTREALALARERGMDLVEVAPNARPPVCKILDYGKLKYTKKKKTQEAKKKQSVVNVKEIQLRPRTEEHDLETKFRHISEFLCRGDKVKITILFRGREVAYAQQGHDMLRRIVESVKDFAITEQSPKLEGRRMIMVIAPGKNASTYSKPIVLVALSDLQAKTFEGKIEPNS